MKNLVLVVLIGFFFIPNLNAQYYDAPDVGWKQTFTTSVWTGVQFQIGSSTLHLDMDTVLNGQRYVSDGAYSFVRNQYGKIYQNKYDWQSQSYDEVLLYDFTLDIGDKFENYRVFNGDSLLVVGKEKVVNLLGDSVYRLHLEFDLNWIVKDTAIWEEGVGDTQIGLFRPSISPDGGASLGCTLDATNRKLSVNWDNTDYCNCQYVYGIDMDNDGFGNYVPRIADIDLGYHIQNPDAIKYYKMRKCDTLQIVSIDLVDFSIYSEKNCGGDEISFDEVTVGPDRSEFVIYNVGLYDKIYFSEQCQWDFAEITLQDCFNNDCDDLDSSINGGVQEIAYNGIDDDCNLETLDDDLDQDGYGISEDCDDLNAEIYPGAIEIVNNGVDEDCDGSDLISANIEVVPSQFKVFPNPTSHQLNFVLNVASDFQLNIYDITGRLCHNTSDHHTINVADWQKGIYYVELIDFGKNSKKYTRFLKK